MDAQRALLDELMGAARNLTEEERKGYKEVTWDDKEVCGFYMVRFCPHDLFVNTRSDLGPCPKIHDQKLKESFESSPRHASYVPKFEADLVHFCEKLVMDLDRRVRRGRERLDQEVEVPPETPVTVEKSEQLSVLEEKIKNLLEQVEALGEAGKVDEAEALMRKVDALNAEKTALTQQPQNDKVLMLSQEKKMALCETCGSFLIANDAIERTQSHVTGKQHIGYGMVRDFLAEYKEAKEKAREEERLAREKESEERRKQRDKECESRRRRSDSGDRNKNRDRDQDREWDRYRERDRDCERSRERHGRGSRDGGRGLDWKYMAGKESAIAQIARTTPGKTYQLSFAVGDASNSCEGSMIVEAFAGKETIKVPYESKGKGGYKRAVLRFVASSDRTRIMFLSTFYTMRSDDFASLCGPVVDDVKLLSVRNPRKLV